MVDAVIGANAPELQRKIMSNLEQEKRILKEGGERIEVSFCSFLHKEINNLIHLASFRTCGG